jgi:hypothetical protein
MLIPNLLKQVRKDGPKKVKDKTANLGISDFVLFSMFLFIFVSSNRELCVKFTL